MKYIVYVTQGQYSHFGVTEILVGDKDPTEILDTYVNAASHGLWSTLATMDNVRWTTASEKVRATISNIRTGLVKVLLENGFLTHDATELWIG